MKKRPLIFLIFFIVTVVKAVEFDSGYQVVFGNIQITDSLVTADIEVHQLIKADLIKSLHRGMTAAFEYQVQLWQQRSRWSDKLLVEKYSRIKISYDPWQKKFILQAGSGAPEQMQEDSLRIRCSKILKTEMIPAETLAATGTYYLALRIVIHPMAVENVEEISHWLSGEAKEFSPKAIKLKDKPGRKAGNWLMKFFLNITGFGDKVISGKSKLFGFADQVQDPKG